MLLWKSEWFLSISSGLCINYIAMQLEKYLFHLYADDTILYSSDSAPSNIQEFLYLQTFNSNSFNSIQYALA